MKCRYRTFGTRYLEKINTFFVSSVYDERYERMARRIARDAKVRSFVYAAVDQDCFWEILRRASPKIIVPLDSEAFSAFGDPAFEWKGLMYYRLKGYAAIPASGVGYSRLVSIIKRVNGMGKLTFNKRAGLLHELLAKERQK